MSDSAWFLYMVRCQGHSLYTGITTNVTRRFAEHQAGKGAKYLRGKAPLELVFQIDAGNHSAALKLESRIKKLSKVDKEKMIQESDLTFNEKDHNSP